MLISEIYHKNVITIDQSTTVLDALKTFIKKRINGLIVVDEHDHVVGVLSIQDIAAATIPRQFRQNIQMAAAMYRKGFFSENCEDIKNNSVRTVMRKNFTAVNLEDNIMAVTADFLKNDLYIVPVFKEGKLAGVVTRSEIKKALAYGMKLHGYY
ncbi:MAG: CBS domain-containing protein [Microgenomates group bacterium]